MPSKAQVHRARAAASRGSSRPTAHQRGYTARWQKASKMFLAAHPLCECDECKASGAVVPAEVVDHIQPHKGDYELFWDENNWQAMSKRHHDRKTAKEGRAA